MFTSIESSRIQMHSLFVDAREVTPLTLSENIILNHISIITQLRNLHIQEENTTGIYLFMKVFFALDELF